MTWAVKFREVGGRAWWFATPKGEGTRLRIHAGVFREQAKAQQVVDEAKALNPDLEFKVVTF